MIDMIGAGKSGSDEDIQTYLRYDADEKLNGIGDDWPGE